MIIPDARDRQKVPLRGKRVDRKGPDVRLPADEPGYRAELTDGADRILDMLKSHFDEGAGREWILRTIELGRKSDAH